MNNWHGLSGRRLLVLSSGRSGSTLMRQYLNCHPGIRLYGELLEEEDSKSISRDADDLITYVTASLASLRGLFRFWPFVSYTGFKVFNEQLVRTGIDISHLIRRLNNPRVIVLYRRDLLETYVSLEIAFRSGCWYTGTKSNAIAVDVEWDELVQFVDTERQRWKSSLNGLRDYKDVVFVTFEELTKHRDETMNKIFQFLDLSEVPVAAESIRQNPLPLGEKIRNFDYIHKQMHKKGDNFQLHLSIQ